MDTQNVCIVGTVPVKVYDYVRSAFVEGTASQNILSKQLFIGSHRLQLFWNLRDSPGFLALVLGPAKPYLSPIVCPGSKLGSCTMSRFLLQVSE